MGDHQVQNAVTTYACINKLIENGYVISEENIQDGFYNVDWQGRFEVINNSPLIVIDGAHNEDSFQKLKSTFEKYLNGKKITLIFGVSEDKDVISMLKIIKPTVDKFIFTKSEHPRAVEINKLEKIAEEINLNNYSLFKIDDIVPFIQKQKEKARVYVAAGSIFVAGAIKQALMMKKSMRNVGK